MGHQVVLSTAPVITKYKGIVDMSPQRSRCPLLPPLAMLILHRYHTSIPLPRPLRRRCPRAQRLPQTMRPSTISLTSLLLHGRTLIFHRRARQPTQSIFMTNLHLKRQLRDDRNRPRLDSNDAGGTNPPSFKASTRVSMQIHHNSDPSSQIRTYPSLLSRLSMTFIPVTRQQKRNLESTS